MMADPNVQLTLTAARKVQDAAQFGWTSVETYQMSTVRGTGDQNEIQLDLPPDAVLEIELDDGERVLLAADEAERYFGAAHRGGAGEPKSIEIGASLAFGDVSRDGLGRWLIRSLTVFKEGPAAQSALSLAGTFQDLRLGQRLGVYRCEAKTFALEKVPMVLREERPVLLFIHGTASSTEGAFADLWSGAGAQDVFAQYAGIYGFEHRSLTESPIKNALDLVRQIEPKTRLHVISHSRGGLVGELLCFHGRRGGAPFSEEDIELFSAHAQRHGMSSADIARDVDGLRELSTELSRRQIEVRRFIRVACPTRGTTLTSKRLDRWATVMFNLIGLGLKNTPVGPIYDVGKSFFLKVVQARTDAHVLPGLEAMMPDAALIALLNQPRAELESKVHVIAGDYEGSSLLKKLGNWLTEAFYGGQNDLVVNTPSMSGGAQRSLGVWVAEFRGKDVQHSSYFRYGPSLKCLWGALTGGDDGYERRDVSRVVIARSERAKPKLSNPPLALLVPGIMGTHLTVGSDRIWLDPWSLIGGGLQKLHVDAAGVSAERLFDRFYGDLAEFLADSHEVRPFPYDWRNSIVQTARRFGQELDTAMDDAQARGKAVRVVAHSMGGLVARLALAGKYRDTDRSRWQRLRELSGSRLIQLGTPNQGSHAMALVLLGRDMMVKALQWVDVHHDLKQQLTIISQFPGVLELLPVGEKPNFFDHDTWSALASVDTGRGELDWVLPRAQALESARDFWRAVAETDLPADLSVYIAGRDQKTPCAVRAPKPGEKSGIVVDFTPEGDGRVTWAQGIPKLVPTWYMDAAHGSLCDERAKFGAILELMETGHTGRLTTVRPTARGVVSSEVLGEAPLMLYPTPQEIENAIFGVRERTLDLAAQERVTVTVVHGSLANSNAPVLMGHYRYDGIVGSARYMDTLLAGRLDKSVQLGIFPSEIGESQAFLQRDETCKPRGAIVVGLGEVGDLTPGELQRTLHQALLRYLTDELSEGQFGQGEVSAILVGAGFGGVAIREAVAALLRAACSANAHLARVNSSRRIGKLNIFEEVFDRAVSALRFCEELVEDPRLRGVFEVSPQLLLGKGRYRRATFESLSLWWRRVRVTCEKGQLRFSVLTERARSEEYAEPTNLDLIHGLIRQATSTTYDDAGLSHALFELLVPNRIKSAAPDERGLVLSLDSASATYPWELMREANNAVPLVVTTGLVRQLSTVSFRQGVVSTREPSALVIGEPLSNFAELPAARDEAEQVIMELRKSQYDVQALIQPSASRVLMSLFERRYRIMHFAGHGVVDFCANGSATKRSGMVIGPDAILTAGEILKLRNVPELVFINCCHLGNMENDASTRERRAELASGLATAFIEMGVRAVVAAGWAIDDRAARTFAQSFYEGMLKGRTFGDAILRARAETHAVHPSSNTWGAYQAYGDPEFCLSDPESVDVARVAHRSEDEIIAEVEMIAARACVMRGADQLVLVRRLDGLERELTMQYRRSGAISAAFARAYAELNDFQRAIPLYEAALASESGQATWRDAEQLANLKVRYGLSLVTSPPDADDPQNDKAARGFQQIEEGKSRIEGLLDLAETAERHALLGSAYKRVVSAYLQGFVPRGQVPDGAINQALLSAYRSYFRAASIARTRSGYVDYYPLLNALDCALLLHTRGVSIDDPELPSFEATLTSLETALQEAKSDGLRRMAHEPGVFHATAVAAAMFTRSLYAVVQADEGAQQYAIDDPGVRQAIVAEYRHQYRRFGSAREWASVASQGKWVRSLLPQATDFPFRQAAGTPVYIERLERGLSALIAEFDQALVESS